MDKLTLLLRRHEGLRLHPYKDSKGIWTIGCGRNLQGNPLIGEELAHLGYVEVPPIESICLTVEQAYWLLDRDIRAVRSALVRALPWFELLDEVRQAALIDMGFMGVGKLLKFNQTLPAIREGRWNDAACFIRNTKWSADVGEIRTEDVCHMITTGSWPVNL